jgi:hypothetical protein
MYVCVKEARRFWSSMATEQNDGEREREREELVGDF